MYRNKFIVSPIQQSQFHRPIFKEASLLKLNASEFDCMQKLLQGLGGKTLIDSYNRNKNLLPQLNINLIDIFSKVLSNPKAVPVEADFCCIRCWMVFPLSQKEARFQAHPCKVVSRNASDLRSITCQAFQNHYNSLVTMCDRNQQEIALSIRKNESIPIFLFGPGGKGKSFLMHILRLYYIQLYSHDQV